MTTPQPEPHPSATHEPAQPPRRGRGDATALMILGWILFAVTGLLALVRLINHMSLLSDSTRSSSREAAAQLEVMATGVLTVGWAAFAMMGLLLVLIGAVLSGRSK